MCQGLSWMFSKHNIWETFAEVMASCRSILFAKNNTGIFLQRMSKKNRTGRGERASFLPICCKAALHLHLRGWEECRVPLWQQPSSVCRCCQPRIWRRGFLWGGQAESQFRESLEYGVQWAIDRVYTWSNAPIDFCICSGPTCQTP